MKFLPLYLFVLFRMEPAPAPPAPPLPPFPISKLATRHSPFLFLFVAGALIVLLTAIFPQATLGFLRLFATSFRDNLCWLGCAHSNRLAPPLIHYVPRVACEQWTPTDIHRGQLLGHNLWQVIDWMNYHLSTTNPVVTAIHLGIPLCMGLLQRVNDTHPMIFLNPVITSGSRETVFTEETCSLFEEYGPQKKERALRVQFTYLSPEDGRHWDSILTDEDGVRLQHAIDVMNLNFVA